MKLFHLTVDTVHLNVIYCSHLGWARVPNNRINNELKTKETTMGGGGLTQLGRFLRKLRIDRNELLRDMSLKLGVAMSFLSAVENGKKAMPTGWAAKVSQLYKLSNAQMSELDAAIAESEKGIGLKFDGLPPESRKLSVAFARKIGSLSAEDRQAIQKLLF